MTCPNCEELERRLGAMEQVVEGVRQLIADDHMFPTSDDAAWGVVTHHWNDVVKALAAQDALAQAKDGEKDAE